VKRVSIAVCIAVVATIYVQFFSVSAAGDFANPAFSSQWHEGETGIPNFWGPLSTAHAGQQESYKEAAGGQRLVQYFDKTRMEITNPSTNTVTNGLLTVELVTGQMQTGDAIFEQRTPARINLAGDPGSDGITYADLARAPKYAAPGATGNGSPYPWAYDSGMFNPHGGFQYKRDGDHYVPAIPGGPFYPFDAPGSDGTVRVEGGPYGHSVFGAFVRFLQPYGTSADRASTVVETVGYPITPFFFAHTTIKDTAQWVLVQAFERRVLTMTADGLVEFGNIGQHYHQWRYGDSTLLPTSAPSTPAPTTQFDFQRFAKRWSHHGYGLTIGVDGYARTDQRTYRTCSDKPDAGTPCETSITSYAGYAIIKFTSVTSDTASGTVLRTNYPKEYAAGATVVLTLKPFGMAEFAVQGQPNPLPLCGPDYGKLAPSEVLRQSPCGA